MIRRRGLTLMELMIALIMTGFVVLAAVSAYATAFRFQNQSREAQERHEQSLRLEQRIRELLSGAYVSADENDAQTYFLGVSTGASADAIAADQLTFTALGGGFNGAQLTSDDDFATLNQNLGPQGGVAEVGLSITPVGDVGQDRQGLFLRVQRPADGDPSQGGYESLLDADVQSIQFEFFNGTDWDVAWGTSGVTDPAGQTNGEDGRRIPAAVRVTYTLGSDPDTQHVFVVQLKNSDVTPDNPVVAGGTTTAPPTP